MASSVSTFILQTLCDHGGSLNFGRLTKALERTFPALKADLLLDGSSVSIRPGRKSRATGHGNLSPDSLVVANTLLRVCQKKAGECAQCDCLHLCKYWVCGECAFGSKCKSPHTLATTHNRQLLKRHGLQVLTEKQLFQLLLQNDPFLLPEICSHYNKGTCKFSSSCTKLHICQHFIQGDCKFGASCKRSHHIDAQGTTIFRGFSQENIGNLLAIYRNKSVILSPMAAVVPEAPRREVPAMKPTQRALRSPTTSAGPSNPTSDADRNEICLFFIRRNCSFQDKCVRVHWPLPYRWQVLDNDGVTWKDLTNMEDVEQAYCDPTKNTNKDAEATSNTWSLLRLLSSVAPPAGSVDFKAMACDGSPVRRLSTASATSKPPHFILTTQWLWYWEDENGQWNEFGQGGVDEAASVSSETLENVFLADRDAQIPFSAGRHKYLLHFNGGPGMPMYQENLKFKTKREVRRRPRFVSAQDVKIRLDSTSSQSSGSSVADSVPSHWDPKFLPDLGYKHVVLSQSSTDFGKIEKLFKQTMPLCKINGIKRIQNPSLWKVYQWQKEQMTKRNKGIAVTEKYLFHGTSESLIDAICEQNFDWRMCGLNGVVYGKGSYFARDASYSHKFVVSSVKKVCTMFVALVLVGEYVRGYQSFARPPSKGQSGQFYDCCVDSANNPSIFVIFEKQQIYPEYLIHYSAPV